MEFKALIFDLDGTAIPNRPDGLPSQELIEAVKKAKEKIVVCAATGRLLPIVRDIFKILELESPCVISGGSQIVNPQTEEILWEKKIPKESVEKIVKVCLDYPYNIYFSDDMKGGPASEQSVHSEENVIFIKNLPHTDAEEIMGKLKKIPDIDFHLAQSWAEGMFDIHVTHKDATKKHALKVLLDMLHLEKDVVIGVGDSGNDLPLFESVGFKVAMGNGTEALKKAADFVTSDVENNGLAKVIESFILVDS